MENQQTPAKTGTKVLFKLGVVLLILACLGWVAIALMPFAPLSLSMKATIVAAIIIGAEIMFWAGAVLVGKDVVQKYKRYLNPKNWRKQKDQLP